MIVNRKVVFPHQCPICKKHYFTDPFEDCPVCEWCNDVVQEKNPNWTGCGNLMSLNEAKKAYQKGEKIQ